MKHKNKKKKIINKQINVEEKVETEKKKYEKTKIGGCES